MTDRRSRDFSTDRSVPGPVAIGLFLTLTATFSLVPGPLAAQEPEALGGPGATGDVYRDRIVAVVGDSIVTESQLEERMLQLQAQGTEIPEDPAARDRMRIELLEALVNEQLVVQAALRDTLVAIDPQRVNELVNDEIEQRTQTFGGQQALRDALAQQGLTMAGYREMLRSDIRSQLLQNQYLASRERESGEIPVGESELRNFFEENRNRLGRRPASIAFEQVVLLPRPDEDALDRAREEAAGLLDSLRAGADFEELARRHSDDPGSGAQGGSLGWFRRGQMTPAFENAVFRLGEGQVSGLVETRFGFHIIRVDRIRGAERRARHILVSPDVTSDDIAEARRRAEEVRESVEAGASIDSLRTVHGAEGQPDSLTVAREQLERLPPPYLDALRNARAGDIVGPLEWGPRDQLNLAVVRVTEVREAGEYTMEEAIPQLRPMLQRQKLLDRIFADLRERTHVEIRI